MTKAVSVEQQSQKQMSSFRSEVKVRKCRSFVDGSCLVAKSCLTLQPHGLSPARLLCPWDFSGKNTGPSPGALLAQGSSLNLLHWQALAGRFLTAEPPGKPHKFCWGKEQKSWGQEQETMWDQTRIFSLKIDITCQKKNQKIQILKKA